MVSRSSKTGPSGQLSPQRYVSMYVHYLMMKMVRLHRRKVVLCLLAVFVVIFLLRYWKQSTLDWDFDDIEEIGHAKVQGPHHENWIVVTTIHHPTDAVKALAHLPGWKLLVVGDRTTPSDWKTTNAIYLDTKAQKSLGYSIHRLLNYDSYTRKSIGYLYAIEHGAKFIYDTDDDNFPNPGPDAFHLHLGQTKGLVVKTRNLTYNPYPHFGQSTVWPRGFPLDNIGLPTVRDYQSCTIHSPAIHQGMVNGDPDVDALFRLTRLHGAEGTPLDVKFDNAAPTIVLPKGTYAPMNSQNTLFTAKAFWALILPTSVSDRTTDIFRSYWAQRLLGLLGENVAFVAPCSKQARNPHSHLSDAKEETAIYHSMGQLVRFLRSWTCDKMFFFDCASQLSRDMASLGFWTRRDADLVDAWISDLAQVGYAPPTLKNIDTCLSKKPNPVVLYPDEQPTVLPHSPIPILPYDLTNHGLMAKFLTKTCGAAHPLLYAQALTDSEKSSNLVLLVSVQDERSIPAIEALQRPMFPHILYCGKTRANFDFFHKWKVSYVGVEGKPSAARCLQAAFPMNHSASGFLYSSDNILMLNNKLPTHHSHLMWVTGDVDAYKPETKALCSQRAISCEPITRSILENFIQRVLSLDGPTKFRSELRQCLVKLSSDPSFQGHPELTWVTETGFYIPRRAVETLTAINALFETSEEEDRYSFLSILAAECLELTTEYLQFMELKDMANAASPFYVFPFPYQDILVKPDSPFSSHFCQHFTKFEKNLQV